MASNAAALLCVFFSLITAASAADEIYRGRALASVLAEFRESGVPLVYSSSLVPPTLLVTIEPRSGSALDVIGQILAPHQLIARQNGNSVLVSRSPGYVSRGAVAISVRTNDREYPGVLPVVRLLGQGSRRIKLRDGEARVDALPVGRYTVEISAVLHELQRRTVEVREGETARISVQLKAQSPRLEEVLVSTSRHDLPRETQAGSTIFGRREIESLSDLGDDPVRVVHRLPGTASDGFSSKSYVRGGNSDELSIILDGVRLVDPFHIRDFQSLFSSINQRAIENVRIYSGGFPVEHGDSLSGVMLIEPRNSEGLAHEIGVSSFSTSFLSSGTFRDDQSDWMLALRRSNLDLLLDPEIGKPSYSDGYAHVGFDINDRLKVSVNGLAAEDDISLIADNDSRTQEFASSDTSNQQFWVKLNYESGRRLRMQTVLSSAHFSNFRQGLVDDPVEVVGSVRDRRSLDVVALENDWFFDQSDRHLLKFGIEARRMRAAYSYASEREIFGRFFLAFEDVSQVLSREADVRPSGGAYAAYVASRFQVTPRVIAETGLRWDKQTYVPFDDGDDQISPRLSLLFRMSPQTSVRASWGRFFQSQDILRLQVEDGLDSFQRAQRSEHSIVSLDHMFGNSLNLRLEIYRKTMSGVQPRFENIFERYALLPELQPDRIRIRPSRAVAQGVELLLSKESGSGVGWWASVTRAQVEDTVADQVVPRAWDQRHTVAGGLSWSSDAWDLSFVNTLHSGWAATPLLLSSGSTADGASLSITPGPLNSLRLPSFSRTDFRAARTFDISRGTLEFFSEITNVLNRENACCVDYDLDAGDDGSFFLEQSTEHWLPRVISIGVLWGF